MAFGATISFQFGVQSHHIFSVWCSKPLSLLSLSVQSNHLLTAQRSEPSLLLSYDVQSRLSRFDIQRCQFSVMAFRATIPSQFSLHSHVFNLVFGTTISFQFGVQSHHSFLVWPSKSCFQFGICSHHLFSIWLSEPPSLLNLAFSTMFLV